ncbi:MAG: hypothetical protein M0Q22_04840 [Sulfuritalea sp.]|jgi:hypothetical protein|nr:hypothetical protein [Sulfuritalea sp.]
MHSPAGTVADAQIPTTRFAYNPEAGSHTARAPTKKFIKGPIPLEWISRANVLPGKAGAVGLALWFLAGVQRSQTVKLTGEIEKIAGCGRKAVYAGLAALEEVGLVRVERRRGARAVVKVISC